MTFLTARRFLVFGECFDFTFGPSDVLLFAIYVLFILIRYLYYTLQSAYSLRRVIYFIVYKMHQSKSNKGFAIIVAVVVVAVLLIGEVLYLKRGSLDQIKLPTLSFLQIKKVPEAPEAPYKGTPPRVYVGPDISIETPGNTVSLKATVDDVDGGMLTYEWMKLSGGRATIKSPKNTSTTVTGLQKGVYVFRLVATDITGFKSADDLFVVVWTPTKASVATNTIKTKTENNNSNTVVTTPPVPEPIPEPVPIPFQNIPPFVSAGPDKSIVSPTNSAFLSGNANDSDGDIISYIWTKVSGEALTIDSPGAATTMISGLSQGSYTLRLTVKDNAGAVATDDVVVTVGTGSYTPSYTPPQNNPPTMSAGPDQWIELPDDAVTLEGSGTDTDGVINKYTWSKISGGVATISDPASATTTVTGLVQGDYTFRLTGTDNNGATGTADVTVSVDPTPGN